MATSRLPEPLHLRHFYDGYPLCWPMDRDGEFEGTYVEAEVTCADCIRYLKEFDEPPVC